jgi:hypothetical protein
MDKAFFPFEPRCGAKKRGYLSLPLAASKRASPLGSASMLPLLSSPFYAFFLSSLLSLRSRFLSDARGLLHIPSNLVVQYFGHF